MLPLPPVLAISGPWEIILVAVLIILLFGAAKIPQLARSLGRAKGEFESGLKEGKTEAVEEEELRREAAGLGIDPEGKTVEELRELVAEQRDAGSA